MSSLNPRILDLEAAETYLKVLRYFQIDFDNQHKKPEDLEMMWNTLIQFGFMLTGRQDLRYLIEYIQFRRRGPPMWHALERTSNECAAYSTASGVSATATGETHRLGLPASVPISQAVIHFANMANTFKADGTSIRSLDVDFERFYEHRDLNRREMLSAVPSNAGQGGPTARSRQNVEHADLGRDMYKLAEAVKRDHAGGDWSQ